MLARWNPNLSPQRECSANNNNIFCLQFNFRLNQLEVLVWHVRRIANDQVHRSVQLIGELGFLGAFLPENAKSCVQLMAFGIGQRQITGQLALIDGHTDCLQNKQNFFCSIKTKKKTYFKTNLWQCLKQRQANCSTSASNFQESHRLFTVELLQNQLDQFLGFRTRNKDGRLHLERQVPEVPFTDDVLNWHSSHSAFA